MEYHFEYFDSNYLYRRDKWHKYEEDKAILWRFNWMESEWKANFS